MKKETKAIKFLTTSTPLSPTAPVARFEELVKELPNVCVVIDGDSKTFKLAEND